MIASCESCGEDFLTESDPHVVRPTKNGYKLYCYCHIKGFDEVKSTTDRLKAENKKLREALRFIRSSADCRNESETEQCSHIAEEALRGNSDL